MKLDEWITKRKIARNEAAKLLELSPAYLTELCQGKKWPSKPVALRIYRKTLGRVTPTDFLA